MEISGIAGAFAKIAGTEETDEQKEAKKVQEQKAKEESVKTKKRDEKDTVELSSTDFDEDNVEEKAANYIQNIVFVGNLTEESKAALQRYMNTFDVSKFVKMYGPFSSTSEITAAMYAATSGLIRKQDDDV